jgi:hypothetical protein
MPQTLTPVVVRNPDGVPSNAYDMIEIGDPVITTITPQSVPYADPVVPFTLTVDGTDFEDDCVVHVDGLAMPTTFVSDVQLTAELPGWPIVGTHQVTVQHGAMTSSELPLDITGTLADLTSITPVHGVAASACTIVGTALTGVTAVYFDDLAATDVIVVDDSTITCIAPAHPDLTDAKVRVPGPPAQQQSGEPRALALDFRYGQPVIDDVIPGTVPYNQGMHSPRVVGRNFCPGCKIYQDGRSRRGR